MFIVINVDCNPIIETESKTDIGVLLVSESKDECKTFLDGYVEERYEDDDSYSVSYEGDEIVVELDGKIEEIFKVCEK